jgi:hypothetical protein
MLHDIAHTSRTRRRLVGALVGAAGLGLVAAAAAWLPQAAQAADSKQQLAPGLVKKLPLRACPDPAAIRIDFKIIKRFTDFTGHIEITGVVKNVGTKPYLSGPTQQAVYLSVKGGPPTPLAQRTFQNLAPGQEVKVSFRRNWNSSSPAEGEFPPTFVVWIGYDPDIGIDGNPQNDDCVAANNRFERSGFDLNAMLQPGV